MGASPRSTSLPKPVVAAVVAGGASMAFVVARDGSPMWQLLRLVAVVAATAEILRILAPEGRAPTPATFVASTCGVAIGVGIGIPHLAKAGLAAATVAGLVLLAAGLVVSGWVGWRMVVAANRWGRVAVVPGLLVTMFVVLLTLGQAVAATNVPPTDLGRRTPADLGLDYEDVAFATADGVELRGWYVSSADGAAVALLHGAGSTRTNVLDHAAVLADAGYGVLLFDARGHGESGGRAMDFGWFGDRDVAAAVSFLEGRSDVDAGRIGVVGLSMGGEEAIGAAAGDPRIQVVVAEGAGHRVAGDKAWLSDEFGVLGAVQEGLDRLTYAVTDLLTDADPPITLRDAVAAAAPRPVLLIAAGEVADEGHEGRYIRSGSPGSVELWVVPGAGHTGGLDVDPVEWRSRVVAFLDDALA